MKSEVIIIGGGLIGITLACILAKSNISTILFEQRGINDIIGKKLDGRASALTRSSKEFLDRYDLWTILKKYVNPIDFIKISDSDSIVDFDQIYNSEPMGYMIENQDMIKSLYKYAQNLPNLKIINEIYKEIKINESEAKVITNNNSYKCILLIAADGKSSNISKLFDITTQKYDFGQKAIVCNISHSNNHNNIAYEKFSSCGPLALLPLRGGYNSSIVWVEKEKLAGIYLKMSICEIEQYLAKKIGNYLKNVKICSKIFSYKISSNYAKTYYKKRLALIGDAAHSIHPIAGQGLNMGIKDIEAMISILNESKLYGYDIGSQHTLAQYEFARKNDNLNMLYVTSILNLLFSNDFSLISSARKLGLNFLNKIPQFKKIFVNYAMGYRK